MRSIRELTAALVVAAAPSLAFAYQDAGTGNAGQSGQGSGASTAGGQAGQTGKSGQAGQAGQTGQIGKSGQTGQAGQGSAGTGQAGQTGAGTGQAGQQPTGRQPGGRAGAQGNQAGREGRFDDALFATVATESGLYEVESSRIALEQSSSDQIKEFAQKMIDDHTQANKELMSAAQGVASPNAREFSPGKRADLAILRSKTGQEFDRAYADQQMAAHICAVGLFKAESQMGQSQELKQFATDTLPKLEHHLQMAMALPGTMSGGHRGSQDQGAGQGRGSNGVQGQGSNGAQGQGRDQGADKEGGTRATTPSRPAASPNRDR